MRKGSVDPSSAGTRAERYFNENDVALSNDHGRNKNLPPIEEPPPFLFHRTGVNKMKPSELKDCISLHSSNSNTHLFDNDLQRENNEKMTMQKNIHNCITMIIMTMITKIMILSMMIMMSMT